MIDPQDPQAYHSAVLDWTEPAREPHAGMLRLYRELIALRAAEPELRDSDLSRVRVDYDEAQQWLVVHRGGMRVVANVSGVERTVPVLRAREVAFATGEVELTDAGVRLQPQSAAIVRI